VSGPRVDGGRRRLAFGELLRAHRLAAGLTQAALAERAHLSVRGIADLERGVRTAPYASTAERLADALGLALSERQAFMVARHAATWMLVDNPLRGVRHNLPAESSTFIGRALQLDDLRAILRSTRLLTLTGPGGVGKSRLGIRLAESGLDAYADGVWLVDLSALTEHALVAQAVALVLGVRDQTGIGLVDTLVNVLRGRQVLLLLDNCEHLRAACGELITRLLAGCPDVQVLAMSRVVIGISGETTWHVPVLSLPLASGTAADTSIADSEAVQLFVERSRAARPEFVLSGGRGPVVADICTRLDGLPLAIELAAAWVRTLGLEEIRSRLDDRWSLLVSAASGASARHRTLRATLDWSYGLLDGAAQQLLKAVSVFSDGASLDAVEVVCAPQTAETPKRPVAELLRALVEASLIRQLNESLGASRYVLLETIREYAHAQLMQDEQATRIQARHAAYFVSLLERPDHDPWAFNHGPALLHADVEFANIRAAAQFLRDQQDVSRGLRLIWSLVPWLERRGHPSELLEWGEAFLAFATAREETLPLDRARGLVATSHAALFAGQVDVARTLAQEAERTFREVPDACEQWPAQRMDTRALAVIMQAYVEWFSGQDRAAEQFAVQAVAHAQRTGALRAQSWALCVAGMIRGFQGQPTDAREFLDRGGQIARQHADGHIVLRCDLAIASTYCDESDGQTASALGREALISSLEEADHISIQLALDLLAWSATLTGEFESAARLLGAANARYEAMGVNWPRIPYVPPGRHPAFVAQLRVALGDSAFAALTDEGRALSDEAVLHLVRA
jgi:predicted ATPase/DNA-binding XRE family transcriptional regulator